MTLGITPADAIGFILLAFGAGMGVGLFARIIGAR